MPWITTMDVRNINVGIVDCERGDISMKIVNCVQSSDFLVLEDMYSDYRAALGKLEDGKVDVILEIP